MRRLQVRVTFFLLTLAVLPALALAQAPVIQISGANFRPLPLAYPAPSAVGQVPRATLTEFDSALSFDLAAAGLFQLLDRKGFTAASSEGFSAAAINFTRWQDVGAEMLAKAQLSMSGDELRGEVRLFNVQAAKENLRADHAVPSRDVRKLAHMLADAIYRQLTHEPPPFNTRLAFVRKTSGGKDVYLSDWDGRNAVAVATGSINLLPAVTPDGTGVAFTSYRKGRPELYVQHPGSAPAALVAAGQMMTGVTFSHDGRKIAYSMADYADDAAALMTEQGLDQALVLGVSFGGMVAQELVLRHPGRVKRLILACTSPGGAGGASFPFHEIGHLKGEARARHMIPISDTRRDDAWAAANPDLHAQFVAMAAADPYADEPGHMMGARRQLEARASHDTWDRLPQIACPVMIAAGRYDGIALPATQEKMAARISGARLRFFEGGHMFMIQDRSVAPAMAAFLSEP